MIGTRDSNLAGTTDGHLQTCCITHRAPSCYGTSRGACNIGLLFCQVILLRVRFFREVYKQAGVPYSVQDIANPRAP